VEHDANSRTWASTNYEQSFSGELLPHVHQYKELAIGMYYKDPQSGEWLESKDEIDLIPTGGAAATQGQHQAYFPPDIYNGEIRLVTANSNVLRSRPYGLSYDDGTNSVLIAELTNSTGQLVSSNQIVYPDAFTDLKADLRYIYTKSGFEQDVILRQAPPPPQFYGLNPRSTRLQVLSEFFSPPQPAIDTSVLPAQAGMRLQDQNLDFGGTQMIRGQAFLLQNGQRNKPALVGKQWLILNGRQFLVEEVPADALTNGFATLPPMVMNAGSLKTPHIASRHLTLPPQRRAENNFSKPITLSQMGPHGDGLVLDYQTINGGLTNFTFQGDTTYEISGTVNLYGTNIFEGGTIIKYDTNVILSTYGSLICKTGPYRPACFTSKDDNSMGDGITGSSGTPAIGGSTYLNIVTDDIDNLHDLRFAYAGVAIEADNENVRGSQFVDCNEGMFIWYNASLYNVLFGQCGYAMSLIYSSGTIVGENLTTDGPLMDTSPATLNLTNCILADGIPSPLNASCDVSSVNDLHIDGITYVPGPLFQATGAGYYYLTNGSPLRNVGTTNIDASLLAELALKTTYSPIVYSNVTFSADTTLNPQVQRDNDLPDLGYHYDPIDYIVDNFWITNATVTVAPGTALACYYNSGMLVTDGSAINSIGAPLAPIWFTRYSCVQEQPIAIGALTDQSVDVNSWHSSTPPAGNYRFTKFSCLAGQALHLYDPSSFVYSNLLVEDCEFWGGKNDFGGGNSVAVTLKNNLFARCAISAVSSAYTNDSLVVSNNLFWNISFSFINVANSNNWYFFNNEFDNAKFSGFGHLAINGYNAYIGNTNRLSPAGPTDVVSTNAIDYQSGPLGYFYQPTDSILINTGSVTADVAGLYHYTTTMDQLIEANSVVDIGYHYIALDGSGNPVDTDGDGIPDYLEDANGNGTVDSGETDWNSLSDPGLNILITRPRNGSTLP
jgi:hypothetical protein